MHSGERREVRRERKEKREKRYERRERREGRGEKDEMLLYLQFIVSPLTSKVVLGYSRVAKRY